MVALRSHVNSPLKAGFTLIEMSIVLVIVGLIIGGVLVGRDLIESARIRAAVTELGKLSQAVNTFRSKYNCLPGDCTNATDYFGAGYQTNPSCTGNGDGNGYIDNWPCESVQALQGLKAAGLMPTLTNEAYKTLFSDPLSTYAFPSLNSSLGYFFYTDLYAVPSRLGTTVSFGNLSLPGGCYNASALTPNQARQIDQKIDDGLPNTGNFLSMDTATPTSNCAVVPASCVNAGANSYLMTEVIGCRTVYFLP